MRLLVTGCLILFLCSWMDKSTSKSARNSKNPTLNYQEYCASCHGVKVEAFADRGSWRYGSSKSDIIKVISNGAPNDGMPSFKATFSQDEIGALADFVLQAKEEVQSYHFEEQSEESFRAVSEGFNLQLELVTDDVTQPWGIAQSSDGRLFVTEKSGQLIMFDANGKKHKIVGTPKVKDRGQGGLMDVVLHPDFDDNQIIYLTYSKYHPSDESLATTAVFMAKFQDEKLIESKDIFVAEPYLPTAHHYGSRIVFDNDGKLYISVGDRGRRDENPQSLGNYCGKIHRLNWDGTIPSDNPFLKTPDAIKSIFSYGHRNPQGLAYDAHHDKIYDNEHGPRGGDEVNELRAGNNYGWPVISYGINYNGTKFTDLTAQEGMEQPLFYWVPSIGVCGMSFIDSDYYPMWKGDILSGSLKYNYLDRTDLDENGEFVKQEKLFLKSGRLRSIVQAADGFIYIGYENPGRIYRIVKD